MLKIVELRVEPLEIELSEPFGIATGAQQLAKNLLVEIALDDGTTGIGEAAPFPAVSGETQASSRAALERVRPAILAEPAARWRRIGALLKNLVPDEPSARCAVECALLDALGKRAGLSLWEFFGGVDSVLSTDLTIPTGDVEHARASAVRALERGFETLKLKVGGGKLTEDVARVRAIAAAAPGCRIVLDANASLTADAALELWAALDGLHDRIPLFEQPTARNDYAGMRRVDQLVPVAADESARSAADVARLAAERCASVVNVKIMKSGVCEALDMIATARAHGLGLMIGGMVESELAMSVSACLAAGVGGFSFVDLDTPYFMQSSPFAGAWQGGPRLSVGELGGAGSSTRAGHGVAKRGTLD